MSETRRASKYPRLGERPAPSDPPGVFCLVLSEHLPPLDATKYFVTTGDAIQKIDRVLEDAQAFLRKARALKKLLTKAKGDSMFLETGWEDRVLLLKQKNLRAPKDHKKSRI